MVIIVAGASGGLGGYVASEMTKDHNVIGTFHTKAFSLPKVEAIATDVTNENSVAHLLAKVEVYNGEVVLVNMTGVTCARLAHNLTFNEWFHVLNVNLNGTFILCRAFLPLMWERKWGRIINVVSVVSQLGIPGTSAYAASKEGVVGLTKVLAKENATKGITVNALSLGYFDRGMIEAVPAKMLDIIKGQIPMGHLGHPSNIVAAIRFLIEADYVTGAVIPINGGLA